jgi:hypothetical protein
VCFSATASFGMAATLTAIGGASVASARAARLLPLAAVPLLYAAQQASEGAVWLVLDRAPFHVASSPFAHAFLFFALFVWPVYVPAALLVAERRADRRKVLVACLAVGVVLGGYLMACATLRDSNACIAFGNLYYWVQVDSPVKRAVLAAYLASVVVPLALSSLRGAKLLALVVAVSFGVTAALYRAGFASVWCFFAAAISGLVAVSVRWAR